MADTTQRTAYERINELKAEIEKESQKLLSELERLLAKSADTYKAYVDSVGSQNALAGEQFAQSLQILNLVPKDAVKPARAKKAASVDVSLSPLGQKIIEFLKKKKQPVDAQTVIAGVDGKESSIKQYLQKLAASKHVQKPSRGMFTVG